MYGHYEANKKDVKDYKYYLFDADGTLIDTAELIYLSYVETIKRFGGLEIPREKILAEIGKPLRENLETFLGRQDKKELEKICREHTDYQFSIAHQYLKLFFGVKHVLPKLKAKGKILAVVSSRCQESLFAYFKELDIFSYFDLFITPESTKKHKPHPEPILKAMKKLKAKPADCLYVGDTQYDLDCALQSNVHFCFVTWSFTKITQLLPAPSYFIAHIAEFL